MDGWMDGLVIDWPSRTVDVDGLLHHIIASYILILLLGGDWINNVAELLANAKCEFTSYPSNSKDIETLYTKSEQMSSYKNSDDPKLKGMLGYPITHAVY